MRRLTTALCILLLPPAAASANTGTDALPEEPASNIDQRRDRDAGSDRAYWGDTALMQPSGTFSVVGRIPLFPAAMGSVNYGVSDFLEVGVGGVFMPDEPWGTYGGHVKAQVLRTDRLALAATFAVMAPIAPQAGDDWADEPVYVPSVAASICADGNGCRTLITLNLHVLADQNVDNVGLAPGASVTGSISKKVQYLAEAHVTADDSSQYAFGFAGVRLPGRETSWDLGLAFAGLNDGGDVFAVPYPVAAFSSRM